MKCRKTMPLSENNSGMADYVLELTDEEAEALKAAVRDADGRKSEVKEAREVLGVY